MLKGEVVQMPCELECVHGPSREINFLDWSVAIVGDGQIITNVFDKRTGMEIYKNVRKFPHRVRAAPVAVDVDAEQDQPLYGRSPGAGPLARVDQSARV